MWSARHANIVCAFTAGGEPAELAAIAQPAARARMPAAGTVLSDRRFGGARTTAISTARRSILPAIAAVSPVAVRVRDSRQPVIATTIATVQPSDTDSLSALATVGQPAVWRAAANTVCTFTTVGEPGV